VNSRNVQSEVQQLAFCEPGLTREPHLEHAVAGLNIDNREPTERFDSHNLAIDCTFARLCDGM
jgi:hypothetical protein